MDFVCPNCSGDVIQTMKKCKWCGFCLDDNCPMDLKEQYRDGRICKYKHNEDF